MVRNLHVNHINKAVTYFYSHSLGFLAKLPIIRINFLTLLLCSSLFVSAGFRNCFVRKGKKIKSG